jgi:hypothetical protein
VVAYSAQMVPTMLRAQHSVADLLGTDVMGSNASAYNTNLETLALIAMVMKAVQDIAPTVATDAFWQSRLNLAIDTGPAGDRSGWPGWVLLQVAPERLADYGATLTDSAAVLQAKINAYNAGQ